MNTTIGYHLRSQGFDVTELDGLPEDGVVRIDGGGTFSGEYLIVSERPDGYSVCAYTDTASCMIAERIPYCAHVADYVGGWVRTHRGMTDRDRRLLAKDDLNRALRALAEHQPRADLSHVQVTVQSALRLLEQLDQKAATT